MKHAGQQALEALRPLLEKLRTIFANDLADDPDRL
jgi:hypothetical protein